MKIPPIYTLTPERTLRYDLKKVLDKGIIEKTKETKGRYYRVITVNGKVS